MNNEQGTETVQRTGQVGNPLQFEVFIREFKSELKDELNLTSDFDVDEDDEIDIKLTAEVTGLDR